MIFWSTSGDDPLQGNDILPPEDARFAGSDQVSAVMLCSGNVVSDNEVHLADEI